MLFVVLYGVVFITRYLHVNHVDVLVHASSQSFLPALLDPGVGSGTCCIHHCCEERVLWLHR